jgi:hypothetical protein
VYMVLILHAAWVCNALVGMRFMLGWCINRRRPAILLYRALEEGIEYCAISTNRSVTRCPSCELNDLSRRRDLCERKRVTFAEI